MYIYIYVCICGETPKQPKPIKIKQHQGNIMKNKNKLRNTRAPKKYKTPF